jgi:hypothetical protein
MTGDMRGINGDQDLPGWRPAVRFDDMRSTYSPEEARELLDGCRLDWWIAGGWALDLFLDERTRDHEDLDVAILRRDEIGFREVLRSWEIWPGLGDGQLEARPIAAHEPLALDRDVLWCRPSSREDWAFELLLSRSVGDEWVFKRDERVRLPLTSLGFITSSGLPILRPEVVLLFKAKGLREKDQQDFDRIAPGLNSHSRSWLYGSLEIAHPGHPWITRL